MAEIKKYLDLLGAEKLVELVKAEDAKVLQSAKDYCDAKDKLFESAGAAATVKEELNQTIAGLSEVYDAKGSAEAVDGKLTTEVNRAKAEEERIVGLVNAAQGKADSNADAIAAINNETTGILAQAKADATTKANAVQANVDALADLVGELPEGTTATDLVEYVNKKTEGIATDAALGELQGQLTAAQGAIDAIEEDYLTSADKTELEGKVTSEETARIAADDEIKASVKAISDDYLKGTDKTELEGKITAAKEEAVTTILGGAVDADYDTLKEVAEWILSDTTGAAKLQTDVAQLIIDVDAVEGRMDTAEGDIDALEGEVVKKVDQTAYNEKVAALEGADSAMAGRLDAIEAQLGDGDGSVSDMIADAKAEAIESATATAAADATSKANAAETAAKAHADGLNTTMSARVDALEAVDHEHSNKALLDTYTQTETDLADAVAKKHNHENKSVLDGITADKVSAWDVAEGNAKTYADGLNSTMTTKVDGIDGRLTTVEGAVATKAEDADLDAAVERIAANEAAIAANTTAISSFTRITEDEIATMFA